MSARWQLSAVTLCLILAAPFTLHAQIYRWDTGAVIPGTEGITPGPGVQLGSERHWELGVDWINDGPWNTNERNLRYADFSEFDLSESDFHQSWLDSADFSEANVTNASLNWSTLTDANLTGANLTNADLSFFPRSQTRT